MANNNWWHDRVPEVDTFCACDDMLDPETAHEAFGEALLRHRLGTVEGHVRVFGAASWLTAAAGEGALSTGEVAVPALVARSGGRTRIALLDVDSAQWARFFLSEPALATRRIRYVADDGGCGECWARVPHASDTHARESDGGSDSWYFSMWHGRLWHDVEPIATDQLHAGGRPGGGGDLATRMSSESAALACLRELSWPPKTVLRCDGCARVFDTAGAYEVHVLEEGCAESAFCPSEEPEARPAPRCLPVGAPLLPAPGVLRKMLHFARFPPSLLIPPLDAPLEQSCEGGDGQAAQSGGDGSLLGALLDHSFLSDGRTSLRAYLTGPRSDPELRAFVLGEATDTVTAACVREWAGEPGGRLAFCPLLRGREVRHDPDERRPHAIRRSLLQMGVRPDRIDAVLAGAAASAAAGAAGRSALTLAAASDALQRERCAHAGQFEHLAVAGEADATVVVAYDEHLPSKSTVQILNKHLT